MESLEGVRGAEVCRAPDVRWVFTGCPILNWIFAADFSPFQAGEKVAAVAAKCRERGQPAVWVTGPGTRPADLPYHLAIAGFDPQPPCTGMALELAPPAGAAPLPAGFRVERAVEPDELGTWADTWAEAPAGDRLRGIIVELGSAAGTSWRYYLGLSEGRPAATCAIFARAEVAGLYWVKVAAGMRGRGLATAVCAHALREAACTGARLAVLDSSPAAESIYRGLGFQPYSKLGWFTWRPTRSVRVNSGAS